jgi:hypothetical protein
MDGKAMVQDISIALRLERSGAVEGVGGQCTEIETGVGQADQVEYGTETATSYYLVLG